MPFFLLYLFLEVLVSLTIASAIGVFFTFLEIIGSAVLGSVILANYGRSSAGIMELMQKRKISQEAFLTNRLFSYIGAFLLILPGFLTDIIGLLLQFEFTAKLFAKLFIKQKTYPNDRRQEKNDDVIDVEIIEKKDEM